MELENTCLAPFGFPVTVRRTPWEDVACQESLCSFVPASSMEGGWNEKDRKRSVTRRSLEDTYREVFGEPRKSERAADDRRRGFEKFSLYHQSKMIYSAGTTVGR